MPTIDEYMASNSKYPKCPSCGYPKIYQGVTSVECGFEPTCPNYTRAQATVVKDWLDEAIKQEKKAKDREDAESAFDQTQTFFYYDDCEPDEDDIPTDPDIQLPFLP